MNTFNAPLLCEQLWETLLKYRVVLQTETLQTKLWMTIRQKHMQIYANVFVCNIFQMMVKNLLQTIKQWR